MSKYILLSSGNCPTCVVNHRRNTSNTSQSYYPIDAPHSDTVLSLIDSDGELAAFRYINDNNLSPFVIDVLSCKQHGSIYLEK